MPSSRNEVLIAALPSSLSNSTPPRYRCASSDAASPVVGFLPQQGGACRAAEVTVARMDGRQGEEMLHSQSGGGGVSEMEMK